MPEPFTLTEPEEWLPYPVRSMLESDPRENESGCKGGRVEGTRRRDSGGKWLAHGELRLFDSEGRLRGVLEFQDGQAHGKGEYYYRDGRPRQQATYIKGNIDGVSRSWYPSGALQCELHWRNRENVGPSRFYYENGQVQSEYTFDDKGLRQGLALMYRADGSELARTLYKDGHALYNMEFREDQSILTFTIRLHKGRLYVHDAATEGERVTYYTPLDSPDPLDVVLPEPPPEEA